MLSFYVKFWTDRQTPVQQYNLNLSMPGHKKAYQRLEKKIHTVKMFNKQKCSENGNITPLELIWIQF